MQIVGVGNQSNKSDICAITDYISLFVGWIFTLEDVDKKLNKTVTEDLFTDTEKLNVIQTCFSDHKKEDGYVKSKFNTAIQELYIKKQVFPFNTTTKRMFEKILKFSSDKIKNV